MSGLRGYLLLLLWGLLLAAALRPMISSQGTASLDAGGTLARAGAAMPGPETWPDTWDGVPLRRHPLTPLEAGFALSFPGAIARFSAGNRVVILRYVATATRQLHPARDCLRAVGYRVRPLPAAQAPAAGGLRSCLLAEKDGHRPLRVCEQVTEAAGSGRWSDVTAWYWAALLGYSTGPWWSATVLSVVERLEPG